MGERREKDRKRGRERELRKRDGGKRHTEKDLENERECKTEKGRERLKER